MTIEFTGGMRETPQEKHVERQEKKNNPPFMDSVDRFLREKLSFLEGIELTAAQVVMLEDIDPYSENSCRSLAVQKGIDEAAVGALAILLAQKRKNGSKVTIQ